MSDLIDRGRLKERLFPVVPDPRGVSKPETSLYMQGWNAAITSIIENEPSAEPKKAVWIGEYDGYADGNVVIDNWYCSNCDYCYEDFEEPDWNYCPNCGAKMSEIPTDSESEDKE